LLFPNQLLFLYWVCLVWRLKESYQSFSNVKGAWVNIQVGRQSLEDIVEILSQPLPKAADFLPALPIAFEKEIALTHLSFRYDSTTVWLLKNIDLTITKGDRIGFIGKTGSGKITLLDNIMGLLQPILGAMTIDGQIINAENCRAWQAHIAHVPQAIFLADINRCISFRIL